MLAFRSPRRIGHAGLSDEHEGLLGMIAGRHDPFGCRNLGQCPSGVDGAGFVKAGGRPWDWPIEREVNFERPRPIRPLREPFA